MTSLFTLARRGGCLESNAGSSHSSPGTVEVVPLRVEPAGLRILMVIAENHTRKRSTSQAKFCLSFDCIHSLTRLIIISTCSCSAGICLPPEDTAEIRGAAVVRHTSCRLRRHRRRGHTGHHHVATARAPRDLTSLRSFRTIMTAWPSHNIGDHSSAQL
jgi:hypothetical protein